MFQSGSCVENIDRDPLAAAFVEDVARERIRKIVGPRHEAQMGWCLILVHDCCRGIFVAGTATYRVDTSDLSLWVSIGGWGDARVKLTFVKLAISIALSTERAEIRQ
jgi:hypothetical protein